MLLGVPGVVSLDYRSTAMLTEAKHLSAIVEVGYFIHFMRLAGTSAEMIALVVLTRKW
jgi:hypothetical protein